MPKTPVSPAELAALLNQPPEAAVAFFQAKGLALTWNWHDQWRDAHSRAFTVAKLARLDILQDIRDGVQRALDTGDTEAAFNKRMGALLQQKGWWGKKIVVGADGQAEVVQEGSSRRLSTIYRANLQSAYMAGRWKQFSAEANEAPFVQYIAVMDGRTRPAHAAFNGKVFRLDNPVWQVIAPPNGFNCRCRIRNLSSAELARRGLKVQGGARIDTRSDTRGATVTDRRTGELDPAKLVRRGVSIPDPDRADRRIAFYPDAGWDYNPGAAQLKPFTPPPQDSLPRSFAPGVQLPDLPLPTRVPASRLLPSGLPPEDYARAFLAEFGADTGNPVVWKDVKDGALVIDEALFQDGAGNWKADNRGRGPYMAILADTIKAPSEIWLRWEQSRATGAWLLKRRYLATFEIVEDGEPVFGIGSFEFGKDGWSGSTIFRADAKTEPKRRAYLEAQRDGFLLYRKN
jgi:SPP1 gp7 family putative phage head morphogenesis protein